MTLESLLRLETLLFLGLVLKAAGFVARDELLLRLFVMAGIAFDISFYALQPQPIMPSIVANAILVAINAAVLFAIVYERTTLALTPRQKRLFNAFGNLTPGQFRRIMRRGDMHETTHEVEIISENMVPSRLYFIEGSRFVIEKGGQAVDARGPAFAGEIAFLTGRPASATVRVPGRTRFSSWPVEDLRRQTRRSRALEHALVARFSLDLAEKVATSMPMRGLVATSSLDGAPGSPAPAPDAQGVARDEAAGAQ